MQACTTLITYLSCTNMITILITDVVEFVSIWLCMLSLYPFDYACWVCTNTISLRILSLFRPDYIFWVLIRPDYVFWVLYGPDYVFWVLIRPDYVFWVLYRPDYVLWVLYRPDYVFWVYTDLIMYFEFVPTWLRIFCSNFWMSPRLTFGWDRTWDRSSASNVSRSLAKTKPMERNNSPLQSETSEVWKNVQPRVFQPV